MRQPTTTAGNLRLAILGLVRALHDDTKGDKDMKAILGAAEVPEGRPACLATDLQLDFYDNIARGSEGLDLDGSEKMLNTVLMSAEALDLVLQLYGNERLVMLTEKGLAVTEEIGGAE